MNQSLLEVTKLIFTYPRNIGVTTIIPFKENPIMNIYLLTKEELNDFLKGYDRYAEFLISIEQAEAIA